MADIKISIHELEILLNEQKRIVSETLLSGTYAFNKESTDGHLKSMQNIDKEKFEIMAFGAEFPNEFKILKKYLP